MMQSAIRIFENLAFNVHAVYNAIDAKINLRKHKFEVFVLGGFDGNTEELMELVKLDEKCVIIEGRPSEMQIRRLLRK